MNIIVLDGYTTNPGDLSWKDLEKFGKLEVYDRSSPDEIPSRIENADIILTNKAPLSSEVLKNSSRLKYISVLATGYNIVDVMTARELGIPVSNVPGYSTPSVAQHTFSLILELTNRVGIHSTDVKNGGWANGPDFSYQLFPISELRGKTLGIIGYGTIGKKVASIGKAFEMEVIAYHTHPERDNDGNALFLSLEDVFVRSDVLSLHCPLTPSNEEMINFDALTSMKKNTILINTARGGLIREEDLREALEKGIIAGAGLDVLSKEPPGKSHPLTGLENCIITPHQAWASIESRRRLLKTTTSNIENFLAGNPGNIVN